MMITDGCYRQRILGRLGLVCHDLVVCGGSFVWSRGSWTINAIGCYTDCRSIVQEKKVWKYIVALYMEYSY